MTRNELKSLIKECVLEMYAPTKPMSFDEAWDHADKIGIPIVEITEKQYGVLMEGVNKSNQCDNMNMLLED